MRTFHVESMYMLPQYTIFRQNQYSLERLDKFTLGITSIAKAKLVLPDIKPLRPNMNMPFNRYIRCYNCNILFAQFVRGHKRLLLSVLLDGKQKLIFLHTIINLIIDERRNGAIMTTTAGSIRNNKLLTSRPFLKQIFYLLCTC